MKKETEKINFYQLLGVFPNATDQEIKDAYNEKFFPLQGESASSACSKERCNEIAELMKQLNAARDCLLNTLLREMYNQGLISNSNQNATGFVSQNILLISENEIMVDRCVAGLLVVVRDCFFRKNRQGFAKDIVYKKGGDECFSVFYDKELKLFVDISKFYKEECLPDVKVLIEKTKNKKLLGYLDILCSQLIILRDSFNNEKVNNQNSLVYLFQLILRCLSGLEISGQCQMVDLYSQNFIENLRSISEGLIKNTTISYESSPVNLSSTGRCSLSIQPSNTSRLLKSGSGLYLTEKR